MIYLLALLIGIIAGLRTMTAPAAASWAARLGIVNPGWLAFMGYAWTPLVLSLLAVGEFVGDLLPITPSRKTPLQFGARIVSGALSGAVIGSGWLGAVFGVVGAVIGTLGGAATRAKLAAKFGKDWPAAIIEDVVAIVGAVLIVMLLR